MTRLFLRFYLAVVVVLFVAWYVHGRVSSAQFDAEFRRIAETAHGGGMRLVVAELEAAEDPNAVLDALQPRFDTPLRLLQRSELPPDALRRIENGDTIVLYFESDAGICIAAPLSDQQTVVCLGPFPEYTHIEESLSGSMLLAAKEIAAAAPAQRDAVLEDLRSLFDYEINLIEVDQLPKREQRRLARGDTVIFYEADSLAFVVSPLSSDRRIVRFGPFPNYKRAEQRAFATTLAVVLLLAAAAIALLLRPVALQLRLVEQTAKTIAGGDLAARVDESRMKSARPLAEAFNHMAGRLETLLRTQRELLQAVSHELRTPLARIRFAAGLIESSDDDEDRRDHVEALDAATEELDGLIGELLSYVRAETADATPQKSEVHLNDLLEEQIAHLSVLHPATRFEIADELHQRDLVLNADSVGVQRVFGNLLNNAGRFATNRVVIDAQRNGHGTVSIDVDDDGPGIPLDERERVFDPFVRLDVAANAGGRGVGLGLSLVRRILDRHGGSVEVLSNASGGCRVRTTWPMPQTPAA